MNLLTTTDHGNGEWARWVHKGDTVYYLQSTYDERMIPKTAGFGWCPTKKVWYTTDKSKAAKLADHAVSTELREELTGIKVHQTVSLAASLAASSTMEFPHPDGYDYYPFQRAGIEYSLQRVNTLNCDEMGIGKTIQALGFINCNPSVKTVLVVCPASIKTNWINEAERWLIRPFKMAIGDSKKVPMPEDGYDFVVINYEVLRKLENNQRVTSIKWDLVILDEVHFIRNTRTLGFRSIAGGSKKGDDRVYNKLEAAHIIGLTGTPVCNRPAELWPLISLLDPEHWNQRTFWYFHKRYCDVSSNGYGMDFTGHASDERLEEIQVKLRETIMIRRLKKDVLTELPPKMRQVVELEYDETDSAVVAAINWEKEYVERRNTEELEAAVEIAKADDDEHAYKVAIERLEAENKFLFEEMAAMRKATAIAKIPYVIEYVRGQLENVEKVVVAAWHHEMIEAVAKAFDSESVAIYGNTPIDQRQQLVDWFQNDPKCRVAVLGIKAAGVGITLTAASVIDVVELPWTPGDLSQVEDRLHRIGQTDTVNVYHLVLKGSIDVLMAKTIIEKQEVVEATLNTVQNREVTVEKSTRWLKRERIIEEAHGLTTEIIAEIHSALKYLSGMDGDYALTKNDVGYNKIDTKIGHELSIREFITAKQAVLGKHVLKKYKRQIPEDIYNKIFA